MANITEKTELTAPVSDDWLYVVDKSDTTVNANGNDKKVTPANLITKAHGLSNGLVKVAAGVMGNATAGTDYYAPSGTDVAVADGGTGASDASGARTNLGLVIGTNVQAYDAQLTDVAGITPAKGSLVISDATNLKALAVGTNNHVLTADSAQPDGVKWAAQASGGINNIVEDTTPQLGGQLDVNGNALGDGTLELLKFEETASAVNEISIKNNATANNPQIKATGDDTNIGIDLVPKGTGNVKIGNFTLDGDQSVGAGQDNYVLTYDNAGGQIGLEPAGGTSAYTPMIELKLASGETTTTSTAGSFTVLNASGTGATAAFASSGRGVSLAQGTSTTGVTSIQWGGQINAGVDSYVTNIFDKNKYFNCMIHSNMNGAGCYADFYFGIGNMSRSTASLATASEVFLGLWIEARNGTLTYYIHANDGTTNTKTNITTAVTNLTKPPDFTDINSMSAVQGVYLAGTSFTLYINGGQVGQITTNLPTGDMTFGDDPFGALFDSKTSNTTSKNVYLQNMKLEFPAM